MSLVVTPEHPPATTTMFCRATVHIRRKCCGRGAMPPAQSTHTSPSEAAAAAGATNGGLDVCATPKPSPPPTMPAMCITPACGSTTSSPSTASSGSRAAPPLPPGAAARAVGPVGKVVTSPASTVAVAVPRCCSNKLVDPGAPESRLVLPPTASMQLSSDTTSCTRGLVPADKSRRQRAQRLSSLRSATSVATWYHTRQVSATRKRSVAGMRKPMVHRHSSSQSSMGQRTSRAWPCGPMVRRRRDSEGRRSRACRR
mmetsp:Transcript_22329/g.60341  ORF Transcript_22329/g.60341 Transcript_22329/m.60341 type:complete len:256 (-) Transcript_22329:42-809(-)